MIFIATLLAYLVAGSQETYGKRVNNRPVVGILSLDIAPVLPLINEANKTTYISSDYVNWVEMSGARVVPVLQTYDDAKTESLVRQLNGFLFTGGDSSDFSVDLLDDVSNNPSPFLKKACMIFDLIK